MEQFSNWFESTWTDLYKGRNHILVTTVLSFAMHEFFYYTFFLPYLICDYIPFLQKYKIQQARKNTPALLNKCFNYVFYNQLFVQLPMQIFFHPVAELFGMRIASGPFPSWQELLSQTALFMVFEDAWQYWFHRLLHHPYFYKRIHKIHHEFNAPFGITAEYAHPLETLILGLGTIGGPLVYVMATGNLHIVSVFFWITVRLFQTVESHSGYDFPWSLRNWVPLWAGADFHDHHHMAFLGNYGSFFTFWDIVTGTDGRYRKWKQSRKAADEVAADKISHEDYENEFKTENSLKEDVMEIPTDWMVSLIHGSYHPAITTGCISAIIHILSYLAFSLMFDLMATATGNKYKIQKKSQKLNVNKCLTHLALNQLAIHLPLHSTFYFAASLFDIDIDSGHPIHIWKMVFQVFIFMLVEDTMFYWTHRLLHHPAIYKYIHKQHHEFTSPYALTADYAHPLETILNDIYTISGPVLLSCISNYNSELDMRVHILTVYVWLVVRIFQTCEAHCGHEFPWSLANSEGVGKFVWCGARFHDYHHQKFNGNYGSSLRFWDWICGTDGKYKQFS